MLSIMFLLLLIIHIERPKFSRKHFWSLETSDRREMGGEERRGKERRGEGRERERERERERDSEG